MKSLSIDFETRANVYAVDLRDAGVYPYAQHPDTDIWCMSYAFEGEEPKTWAPQYPVEVPDPEKPGQTMWIWATPDFPAEVAEHVLAGGEIRAWNAAFERIIWREILTSRYGAPLPRMEQFVCSAAEAAAMGLPRSLDHAAKVLGVDQQKDEEGYQLMMRMTRPRSKPGQPLVWWTEPTRVRRLITYCEQDVRTEQAIVKKVRRLTPKEREIYLLDQRINDRGITLDQHLAKQARALAKEGIERATMSIHEITNGAVSTLTQSTRLREWLNAQGVEVDNVRKSTVRDLLESDLSPEVQAALTLRAEGAKSSVAKIDSMLACVCNDGRIRGLLLYHGASTGRWTGRLVQPQNFPRGEVANAEQYIELVLKGVAGYDELDLYEPPLKVISALLRPMLVAAPGHELIAADYSAIEARVLAWLAGQHDLVEVFRSGGDVYKHFAAKLFSVPLAAVTKEQRQFGKVGILGCGYGMGAPKLRTSAAEQYGLDLSEDFATKVVQTYRGQYDMIPDYWYALEAAARWAVLEPGTTQVVHPGGAPIKFSKRGAYLWLVLPSGRPLAYANPKVVERETPWGELRPSVECMGVNSFTRKWEPYNLYGGLIAENVVQAVSRDLLAEAMLRLDSRGYPVILSVHDEVVSEVPAGQGSVEEFERIMCELPEWAPGCPVAAEGWAGPRYRK